MRVYDVQLCFIGNHINVATELLHHASPHIEKIGLGRSEDKVNLVRLTKDSPDPLM